MRTASWRSDFASNLLLGLMRPATKTALFPLLEQTSLVVGDVLYREGKDQDRIYFPSAGVVSLLYMMKSGKSAELALVGSEGLVGFAAILGGKKTTNRAVVQVAGAAFYVKRRSFERLVDDDSHCRHLMLCYMQSLLTQFAQTAVCNRHHTIEQQWCRWMLLSLDRNGGEPVQMTQQTIANMLGVRREGVSAVASGLQLEGAIEYSRGTIVVRDRQALERQVCECYGLVVEETERLIPGSSKRPARHRA